MTLTRDYTDFFDIQRAELAVVEQTRQDFTESLRELLIRLGADRGEAERIALTLWADMTTEDRHYHTPVHVLGAFGWTQRVGFELTDAEELALWFHDAIFDTQAPPGQNEVASAKWMRWIVSRAGVPSAFARHAAEAIAWTGYHLEEHVPREFQRVMDLDLAGFAAAPEVFRRQSKAVQAEMAHLSTEQFQRGTINFFKQLLGRQHLYRSRTLAALEPIARQNLQQEIERLTSLLGSQPT